MEGDVRGVRIIPPTVEFRDIDSAVQLYSVTITVKNISKVSKEIRYWPPQDKVFHLQVKNPEKPVAPGLEVSATVEFEALETKEYKDRIVVTVDGEVIEIPVTALPCQPQLSLQGPVDFGNVVANSKVIRKQISLYNHGSKEGEFKLRYSGRLPIAITPSGGKVPAHSVQIIKVEYVTKEPGHFDEKVKVKLEGQEVSILHVCGNVVEGHLELLSYESEEEIHCVEFGSAYYGTDKTQSAILYNNGPEPVSFVAVLDENATGQEVGTDLSKSTTAALVSLNNSTSTGHVNPLTSLVTALPNQGILAPYEKIPIFFRFSPRWTPSTQGYTCCLEPPPRNDFALFMYLKVIGASCGFQENAENKEANNIQGSTLEIALKATALPVLIALTPQTKFDFGDCPVGMCTSTNCSLVNESSALPVSYQFRRIAHFTVKPDNGKIKPGQSEEIQFLFAPNQAGTFKPTQYVDILGQVADNKNPFVMQLQVIHSLPISFLGFSKPVTVKKAPVFNPGITPKITNEVGLYVDTTFGELSKTPRAAVLNAANTKLHRFKSSKERSNEDKTLVAFPNDRAQSVRPSNRNESYRTIFTHTDRHTYLDPDYSYADDEIESAKQHRNKYVTFIDDMRKKRHNAKETRDFNATNNDKDLGMKPAGGLRPKKLTLKEVGPDPRPPTPPNVTYSMLSTKQLAEVESVSSKRIRDGLNALPLTPKEKADCQKILSPQQLHQVIIGPPTIDFGNVCLKSVIQKDLSIVSGLDQYIHVVVHVDCRELRQTSPLSQVIPPHSKAVLPLIFESNTKGRFQRSLDYTVNGYYKNHVTVFAEVVPVSLELSTDHLIVEPQVGLPADAGIRGVITLKNKLNYQAEFTWSPILGDRGTAFSIRPATGVVDAFTDLDCEVVFHPSYLAPEDGEFALQVHGGNTLKLKCLAKIGTTNVSFIDRRISFGQVPLHQTTIRTAMLKNNSLNHAYYQVLDPNPFPGLTVSPIHGVVPVGGVAEIKVHLTPNSVMKFDTRINISIRGWKTLELRMGGTVEPPCVDIDLPSFNFGGVYCGSSMTMPFTLINKVYTKARIEFNLSKYADFSLEFPGKQTSEDYSFQLMNPGMYSVMIDGGETITCQLIFNPTEVASYDFIMPVTINQTGAPTPSPTPFPPTPAPSNVNSLQHIIQPRPIQVHIATPRRKVIATALRQPLQLSHHKIDFLLSPISHQLASSSGIGQSKGTLLVNNSDKPIKWAVDISKGNQALEEGIFKFLHPSGMPYLSHGDRGVEGDLDPGQTVSLGVIFCPDKPGHYEVSLPIVLNSDYETPYQYITLSGELKCPHVWFDPLAIVLTPVPLDMEISADFLIMATDYISKSHLTVEVPEIECDDGSKIKPLSVNFLESDDIPACCSEDGNSEPVSLRCQVNFKSSKTVSFSTTVVFLDDLGNRFQLPVTATSDNCLMTCYPFLALHRSDHQIVCEQGTSLRGRKTASRESMNAGEAVLMPCESPHRPSSRPSTTATSSNFEVSSSSFEDSTQSLSDGTFPSTPRDGAMNKFTSDSEQNSHGRNGLQSRSLGSALFPEEDTEEGIFHTEVLLAVQRWFSSQGWPNGPNPITIPDSLRSGISKKPAEIKAKNAKGGSFESTSLKKEMRTVYDMIAHLCGRHVPGIPINNPLPSDPVERAKQIYWQHSTLLTFLKAQGACIASIKPEYLMEPTDYKHWARLQKEIETKRNKSGHREIRVKTEEEEALEEQLFEAVSKRAWTDILLQLLKTLHLAKITPRQFKNLPTPYKGSTMPMVDPDPLCSNVYSLSERIILLWLNHNYEQQRQKIWADCTKGGVPPSRWVVNFDFDLLDGLVLAAALGAHAPFLIKAYLQDMYTHPSTAEQCLHNALKVVNAMRFIGIDYDIQAIDITDPNPISLLLLCVHFYNNLPQYLPKSTVDFVGSLHMMVLRQVKLSNPSSKPLVYHAIMAGPDAEQFVLPKGHTVTISPKSTQNVSIEFTSRFLRPTEAVLVLVGRRQGSNVGSTVVFSLKTQIDNVIPKTIVKVESPCYELTKVPLEVTNLFSEGGNFKITLLENNDFANNNSSQHSLLGPKKKKLKKIQSKINTGISQPQPEEKVAEPSPKITETMTNKGQDGSLCAFHSPSSHVHLDAGAMSMVNIHYLPFQVGKMQCSVIFQHDKIGDIVYSIEATATLPLPMALPFRPSSGSSRISMIAATGGKSSITLTGGEDHTVYWKCETNQEIKEVLHMPLANIAKDKALITVAQQNMSEKELERRKLTGTLASGAITAKAVNEITKSQSALDLKKTIQSPTITFSIELDSKHFAAPNKITVANPNYKSGPCQKASQSASGLLPASPNLDLPTNDGIVELPITFSAKEPGVYPCHLTVKSTDDIRTYYIECMVTPEGSEAVIEFASPVHETITQEIPVVNQTSHDWPMVARIEGVGFTGPQNITAKAYTTTKYPLSFKPQFEGIVEGKLILANTEDHIDHVFHLRGNGDKPLPLDHIKITAEAKKSQVHMLRVPNVTRKKLFFRIQTDLPYLSGPDCVTVLPGQTGSYELLVTPLKHGHHKGVITFIAGPNPVAEVDSDGDEVADETESRLDGYRLWYAADMVISPPPPEKVLELSCPCQKQTILEIGVNNPTNHELTLDAEVKGEGLSGPAEIQIKPKSRALYEVVYAPAVVGKYNGSVQFFHPAVGEFWYSLSLVAEKPLPTTLPHLECELGRWVREYITLNNPTDQLLKLIPTVSNTNNFKLELDSEQPFELPPHTSMRVPVTFMPSTLGFGDHKARISFHCEQLGEWVFFASGTGILPQAQDPVSITAPVGSSTTLIIPFRNPLDMPVLVDVKLSDKFLDTKKALDLPGPADSPFCLLLKDTSGIHLGPKSILDLPISFSPEEMKMSEAECVITVRQEDGTKWFVTPSMELKAPERSFAGWESSEIKWVYPVRGYPEHTENKDVMPAVVSCQARERVEERLEVSLSGVAPSAGGPKRGMKTRAITPQNEPPRIPEGVVVAEGLTPADEFTYEIIYGSSDAKKNLEHAVALKLIRQQRDRTSGLVTLVFDIIYAPYKSMHYDVQLLVQGATGGLWRFPLRFTASEPEPDDVITVEAVGLDRIASVGFRLTSQTSHPVPYNAYFLGGSDPELSITPSSGELMPVGSKGTLLKVSFRPTKYGKIYQGKLVIQCPDMQWTYNVRGVPPDYTPPRGYSSHPIAGPHPDPRHRSEKVSFIRENLKLTTTAVSSPIKGAPLLNKHKTFNRLSLG